MISIRVQSRIALGFFLLAALLGVALRAFPVFEIPANYRHLVHTHSHLALLGWVYLALTTLLYKVFIGEQQRKKYKHLYWFTWATVVGMMLTFPFWGYAPLSIFYSTAFLFASYWYTWFFHKHSAESLRSRYAFKFVSTALGFMVLSSLGPWALGFIINTVGPESIWYRLAIYFFLHFQYNGWMTMALVGLLLLVLNQRQTYLKERQIKFLYWLLVSGIVLTFLLSTLWTKPTAVLYFLGGIGAAFQLMAFAMLFIIYQWSKTPSSAILSAQQGVMLKVCIVLLAVKLILQLITAFPYFADLAAIVMDFTIGYLHWTFLGVVSFGIFLALDYFQLYPIASKGYWTYLLGFLITETLIFYKGLSIWQQWTLFSGYFEILLAGSMLIPLGLIIVISYEL